MSGRYPYGRRRSRLTPNQLRALRNRNMARMGLRAGTLMGMWSPRGMPSSRSRRRAGGSYGSGLTGTTGGSRVAPTQRFGMGAARAGYMPAEMKVFRTWTDPSGVSDNPVFIPVDASGYTHGLSEIDQGASYEERVGAGVRAKDLTLRLSIRAPVDGVAYAGGSACVRLITIRCKNSSGSLDVPTVGKVLEYTGTGPAVVGSPLSHSGNGKYTVLDDHRVVLNPSGETGSSAYFDRVINVGRNITWEEGDAGDEFVSGGIYVLMVSNQEAGATDAQKPSVLFNSTLRFFDA